MAVDMSAAYLSYRVNETPVYPDMEGGVAPPFYDAGLDPPLDVIFLLTNIKRPELYQFVRLKAAQPPSPGSVLDIGDAVSAI
ncbi:unnamed protein product [Phytophthora fragariaefolia]|uniref:Unnamed protein product n=1 Tax=Phytophthora fragariaefolia TaxID=1490495 RepID=A0A9W6Y923_9STRA|nr:unnamed protein product [Phytophthora fragariaefolia]